MGALLSVIIMVLTTSRRGWKPELMTKIEKNNTFHSSLPPYQVGEKLPGLAKKLGYRVEEKDVEPGRVVLGSRPPSLDWGLFFPVHFAPLMNGGTSVEVGVVCRALLWAPFVKRGHKRLIMQLKKVLETESPAV